MRCTVSKTIDTEFVEEYEEVEDAAVYPKELVNIILLPT